MHKLVLTIVTVCLWAPVVSRADNADAVEVARELGSALAWRLGPEAVEEACRSRDPDGAEARKIALKTWLEKNAALIEKVDARVAEVAPLIYPSPANVDTVQALRAKVKEILLEPMLDGKTAEQSAAICKAESDPAGPRWNSNGMPQVQQALAVLYDWKVRRAAK